MKELEANRAGKILIPDAVELSRLPTYRYIYPFSKDPPVVKDHYSSELDIIKEIEANRRHVIMSRDEITGGEFAPTERYIYPFSREGIRRKELEGECEHMHVYKRMRCLETLAIYYKKLANDRSGRKD